MSEHTALTAVRWVRSEPHNDLGLWHSRLLARRVRFEQRWAARFFRPDSTAPKKRGPEGLQAEPDKGDGHQVCISVASAGPKPRPFSEWRKTTISKKPKIDHEYHAGKDKMKITIKGYRAVSLAGFCTTFESRYCARRCREECLRTPLPRICERHALQSGRAAS